MLKLKLVIMALSILLVAAGISGCTQNDNGTTTPTPTPSQSPSALTQEESQEIAVDYVKNMEEYTDYEGRNLKLINNVALKCPYCWSFTYQFDMQSMKDASVVDEAKVRVIVQEGEVVEVFYALGMKSSDDKPEGSVYASELLTEPAYKEQVKVYGEVSKLGESDHGFELPSGGETLEVYYGTDAGVEKPEGKVCCQIYGYGKGMEKVNVHYAWATSENCTVPEGFVGGDREIVDDKYCRGGTASVEDLDNGDWVVVTGQLKQREDLSVSETPVLWAYNVEKVPQDYCCKDTMECMSITEARKIAVNSECGDNLTDSYTCNNNSGTWWIDLDIEKKGCNPACVVDVIDKQAEINWRCTGFDY
ncbi:MAG: hypothetical protein R6U44_00975 [Archaeoglobaceae archaeon]